jgi:SAM-dependent methyltransferase
MSTFKDHFSASAAGYAAHRPRYPESLVDFLADLAPGHDLVLDAGCGTGQLSTLLTRRFRRVIATDASACQIEEAEQDPRVEYRIAPAEHSSLEDRSADLITVAQAAHWFDLPSFYEEVWRVLRPDGVLALVTYGILTIDQELDPLILGFYSDVVGPYWPPERRHVEEGYRSLPFPFAELAAPSLAIEVAWSRDDFLGYVETWSALRGAEKALGREPINAFRRSLLAAWPPGELRTVRFPLSLRVGRI